MKFILTICVGIIFIAWYDSPKTVELFVNTKVQPILSDITERMGAENIFQPNLPSEYSVKEMSISNNVIYIPYYRNKMIFIQNNSIYLSDKHTVEVKAFKSHKEALAVCNQHFYHNK